MNIIIVEFKTIIMLSGFRTAPPAVASRLDSLYRSCKMGL